MAFKECKREGNSSNSLNPTVNNSIEQIEHNGKLLAVIIRSKAFSELKESGKKMLFASPKEFPFQMGIHHRQESETIPAHAHIPFEELKNFPVQEFFYLLSGKIRIDLYEESDGLSNRDKKIREIIVSGGDSVVLNTAHGFTFLEETQMVEIKQGPYRGKEQEKRVFEDKFKDEKDN